MNKKLKYCLIKNISDIHRDGREVLFKGRDYNLYIMWFVKQINSWRDKEKLEVPLKDESTFFTHYYDISKIL